MFDSLLRDPMKVVDGWIEPRTAPGFCVELDDAAVARYRIA
jgi:L-alanine-DL-glutamate epimerase-like enolase superfamily enzyme